VLGCTVIDSKPRSNDCLSVQGVRSPGQADARIEVLIVWVVQGRIFGTRRRVDWRGIRAVCRVRPQAHAMELIEIKNRGSIVSFMRHPVVLPAEPEVKGEIGSNLPLILKIGAIERAPKFVTAARGGE